MTDIHLKSPESVLGLLHCSPEEPREEMRLASAAGQPDVTTRAIETTTWLALTPDQIIPPAIPAVRLGAGEAAALALALNGFCSRKLRAPSLNLAISSLLTASKRCAGHQAARGGRTPNP